MDTTIRAFTEHVSIWTSSLARYESLDWTDVRHFIDEISGEAQLDFERMSRSVGHFVRTGTPTSYLNESV